MGRNANVLEKNGRDLTLLAANKKLPKPSHRDTLIDQALTSLERKRSVLLLGAEGVGKSAILHGVVHRLLRLDENKKKKRCVFELSTGSSNLFDFYQANMNDKGLLLMGEITLELLQEAQKISGFLQMFDIIKVDPFTSTQVNEIVQERASSLKLDAPSESIERVIELCDQFLSASAGPQQPLLLLDRVKHYATEKTLIQESEDISPAFVEKVFSIYSGLPLLVIDTNKTVKVNDIRNWFRERIIGQEAAIEAIVDSIIMFKAAINDPDKPLGTFLFVGPTGVGKTELAKALAVYLFGSERRLLRFDLSEFSAYSSFKSLIGDPENRNTPARLTDAVQQQPFQVILFDELEKGHTNIWDLLLQILDDGRLSNASGKAVSFRNTFVIATSNVGAKEASRQRIGFGDDKQGSESAEKLREGLEAFFRPEFLNRFQQIVSFHALRREHVERIVRKEITLVLGRRGISARNLAIDLTDELITHVSEQGYDAKYGARALKREIQRQIVMPIATLLTEQKLSPGSILKLDAKQANKDSAAAELITYIRVLNSEQSVAHKQETQPIKGPDNKPQTRASLQSNCKSTRARIKEIRKTLDSKGIYERQEILEKRRLDPNLWSDVATANAIIVELDNLRLVAQQIDHLHDSLTQISELLKPDCSRDTLGHVSKRLTSLNERITTTHRELVLLGTAGKADVLLELSPMGESVEARNVLFKVYQDWAQWRGYSINMLHEPVNALEPILVSIEGEYCNGYLRLENGIHRFRHAESASGTVRVRVVPWVANRCDPKFESRVALKKTGQLNGRIRSRSVLTEPTRLTLQNSATLEVNREIASLCALSWKQRAADVDENIRRYDLEPYLIKDLLTQQTFTTVPTNRCVWRA